jgi:hypothetical protein
MMTGVACFCGCFFSFNDGEGACPKCGRVARVTTGPVLGRPGHNRPEHPVPVMNGAGQAGQAGQTRAACPDRVEFAALPGIAIERSSIAEVTGA